jgi:hypothetical protein
MYLLDHPTLAYNGVPTIRGLKLRQPIDPVYVKPAFERGHRNDGNNIEVLFSEDEEEDMEPPDEGFEEVPEIEGQVYKLHSRTIQLDFINRVKR